MKKLVFTILIASTALVSNAQWVLSAGGAVGSDSYMGTLGIEYDWTPLTDKFHINPGVRLNVFGGSGLDYLTAPAKLTADEANMDTANFGSSQANFANLFLRLQYDITEKISLGFDIDLVGVTFGAEQTATYYPGPNAIKESKVSKSIKASPTTINALLIGDNDLGSLNSTLTLSYSITDRLGVDLGAGLVFTEYTAAIEVGVEKNDRFRNKNMMGYAGITYRLKII